MGAQEGRGEARVPTSETDGRRLRRETNRRAVIDALVGLQNAGHLEPTIEEIAAAAGLSSRSVFRYFTDVEDLVQEAVARQQRRLAPLLALDLDPEMSLVERIEAFVEHRLRLIDAMGNVALVARLRAHAQPLVAAEVTRMRRLMREQVDVAFAPELGRLDPEAAKQAVAALDVLASFEAQQLLRNDQQLSATESASALSAAIAAILGATR